MIGEIRKYWDRKDEASIVEFSIVICDICNKEYDWHVGEFHAIPPHGIATHAEGKEVPEGYGELFICGDCIKEKYFEDVNLDTIISHFKQFYPNNFNEELLRVVKFLLPQIFELNRKQLPKHLRDQILKKFNYKCFQCGATKHLAIDHINPYSKGGSDNPENLQVLCRSCNSKKGTKHKGKSK